MWPPPWCVTLTLLMTCSHIQRIKNLKWVKLSFFSYDLDLDLMTLKLDLDMIKMYLHTKKWSFYVKRFKSYSLNRAHRQTHRQTWPKTFYIHRFYTRLFGQNEYLLYILHKDFQKKWLVHSLNNAFELDVNVCLWENLLHQAAVRLDGCVL